MNCFANSRYNCLLIYDKLMLNTLQLTSFEDTAEKLKSWEFWNCKKTADGTSYISFFAVKLRKKY